MSQLKKWKLLKSTDVSPSKWFPLEKRIYELPNGKIVDDFFVTTLSDVAMVVPITKEGKILMVQQYKPGIGEFTIEFPAGRFEEKHHKNFLEAAKHELEEEAGVITDDLEEFSVISVMPTKATEQIHCFIAKNLKINSTQKLDENENIEVLFLEPEEIEQMISSGKIRIADTIACWDLAKRKFPEIFLKK